MCSKIINNHLNCKRTDYTALKAFSKNTFNISRYIINLTTTFKHPRVLNDSNKKISH